MMRRPGILLLAVMKRCIFSPSLSKEGGYLKIDAICVLKSPLEKGGLRGIFLAAKRNPPQPPFF
jgi:hypothetical protein